ncbi:MAG TPA: sigma-70 family RNA polymerase sigma factor [Methylomirabilota bacterium]|nr:sigma-70 family RNA polymerase sigma factor [Methylomirabilota bacterium]
MTTALGGAGYLVEHVFRGEYGRLVAAVARMLGDLDAAEETVQEALAAALVHWPDEGLPDNPGAWLMTVARNRARDHLRRRRRLRARVEALARELDEGPELSSDAALDESDVPVIADERLRLIFTCCHPELAPDSRVALTLRLVGGLSTGEIARAFLVTDTTIGQRIVRAKRTIRDRRLPYAVPEPAELPERLASVLAVIYLVFNEGHTAREGDRLVRHEVCEEALRLGATLAELMPAEGEVLGLLALMELTMARTPARTDAAGDLVLLADQDRTRWDPVRIVRGLALLERAGPLDAAGPYRLQAAIAACHARAESWPATDWGGIAVLYARLQAIAPSPVVALNRAVAVSMAEGPAAGLALLDALETAALAGYHHLPAARGDCLRRLGRWGEAARAFRRAGALTQNRREQAFFEARAAQCDAAGGATS